MFDFTRRILLTLLILSIIGLSLAKETEFNTNIQNSISALSDWAPEEKLAAEMPLPLSVADPVNLEIIPVDPICEGEDVWLSPTVSSDEAYAYEWYEVLEDGSEVKISDLKGKMVYDLKKTTTFVLKAYYFTRDLVTNGDFGAAPDEIDWAAHRSDYDRINTSPKNRTLYDEGTYHIDTNPKAHHTNFSNVGDNTTGFGNMFMVNGSSNPTKRAWYQTGIVIQPNTTYAFTAWGKSLHPSTPARLEFDINGDKLGILKLDSNVKQWDKFYVLWNSGPATIADISLVNLRTQSNGNDFALDDISFSPLEVEIRSIEVMVHPQIEIETITEDQLCLGQKVVVEAKIKKGDNGAANMLWTKDGVAVTDPNVSINGAVMTIDPFQEVNQGTYEFTMSNDCFSDNQKKDLFLKEMPEIEEQPVGSEVCVGDEAVLRIKLNGGAWNVQWYHNDVAIPGATNEELKFIAALTDAGSYKCVITDDCNGLESEVVTLVVYENTVLTKDLTLDPICSGGEITMEVDATGSGTLYYQWYRGASPLSGATNKQYTFTATMTDDGATFYCIVSSSTLCGTAKSSTRTLQVNQSTLITKQPEDHTACVGDNHSFKVEALAENIGYQWQFNDVDIGGANSASLVLNNIQAANAGNYKCVVTGSCGPLTSNVVSLTVHEITRITNTLPVFSQCPGTDVSYSVATEGTINKYTWLNKGVDLNLDQAAITLSGITSANAGKIEVIVDGVCDSDSRETTLDVLPITQIIDGPDATSACVWGTASFSVIAVGENLTYDWKFGGSSVGDQATLDLSGLAVTDAGTYSVAINGTCGPTANGTADLTVKEITNISTGFSNQTACETDNVTLSVTADGVNNNFKWYKDGGELVGETAASLTLNNVLVANSGLYKIKVFGDCKQDSVEARLDVYKNTLITTGISDQDKCIGNSASFSVVAEGENLSYAWTKGGVDQGVNSSTYTIATLLAGDVGTTPIECTVTGTCGSKTSSANLIVAPTTDITVGISDSELCVGMDKTFTVTAVGNNLTYQWQYNGGDMPGETASSLALTNVQTSDGGNYKCIVTGQCGEKETTAVVTIRENVTKNNGLADLTLCEDEDVTLSVDFSGSDIDYEWKKEGIGIGSNQNSYSLTDITQAADGGTYTCRVTSPYTCGDVTETMVLTVDPKTYVATQPSDETQCEGGTANYSVVAGGAGPYTYQWYQGTNLLGGETNSNLAVTPLSLSDDGNTYHCVVTGSCGSEASSSAKLKVYKNVSIVSHPSDITVPDGETTVFSVNAEGAPTLQYQWYEDGGVMPGETSSTLSVVAATLGNDGHEFHCVVTSSTGCGTVTSAKAKLTVDATAIVQEPESEVICDGQDVVFTCKAEGAVTFEWRRISDNAIMASTDTQENPGPPELWRSELKITAAALAEDGSQYKCIVDGLLGPIDSRTVTLTVNKNNSITDPADQTVCPDTEAVFEVTADGDGTLSYEWFDNSNNSVGTEKTLVLQGTPANAAKTYYCQVSSTTGCGTPKSSSASLSLDLITTIATPVSDAPVCVGGSKTFDLIASASGVITYTWTHNGNDPGWGSIDSKTISPVALSDAGTYVVKVDGNCGSAQSAVDFKVKEYPNFTQTLTDATKCEGEDLDLTVDASGSDLVYEWYKDNVLDAGVTGKKFSLTNLSKLTDAVEYRCEISNMCDTKTTSAILTLKTPVALTTTLSDPDACDGDNVVLQVVADGDDKVYQWYKGGNPVGLNQPTYSISPATLTDADQYSVKITGYCNEKTSSADVTINENTQLVSGFTGGDYCEGDDVHLAVFANGVDLHYAWTQDGVSVFGDQNQVSILGASVDKSGHYKCVVTGKCGSPVEVEADVSVHPITNIVTAFPGREECEGNELTLGAEVDGDNLSFVWTQDGTDLLVNNDTLVLNNALPDQSGLYTMKVNGICGDDVASAQIFVKKKTELVNALNSEEIRCEGEEVLYNVSALGNNLKYEWYYNGGLIPSETTNQLHISKLVADTSGVYLCKVIGDCDILQTSSELTVHPATKILSGFGDTKVCEGSEITLQLDATGANVSYKWDHNGTLLPDNTEKLSFTGIDVTQAGTYTSTVTGICGEVKNIAELDVRPHAVLNYQTGDQTVCEIDPSVSFEVNVNGDDLVYQWKKDSIVLAGENNPVLIISPIHLEDIGSYVCDITTSCGDPIESVPVQLMVNPRSYIVLQPESHVACEATDIDLSIKASGLDLTYQWRKDGVDISGAVDTLYHLSNVSVGNAGVYDCLVSSSCGTVLYSSESIINVEPIPGSSILGRMDLCGGEERVLYQAPLDLDLNYSWTVDEGLIDSGEDTRFLEVTWNEATQGALHLTVESMSNGCTFKIDSVVNLRPLPDVHLAEFDSIGACKPSFELFGANIAGGIYHVDGNPSKVFEMDRGAGEYTINYTFTDANGCSASSEYRTLVVNPLPKVKAYQRNYDIGTCEQVRLSAQSTETNYTWGPSIYLDAADVRAPRFAPGETQRLRVLVTDRFGCSAHDYVSVNVAPAPGVLTISDTTIGECQKIRLNTENLGAPLGKIQWNYSGDLDHPDILSPVLEKARVGSNYYTVHVEDTHGCGGADSVLISVVAAPNLGDDRKVCEGEEVAIDFGGAFKSLSWEDGYVGNSRVLNQVGVYHIHTEDDFGCMDELEVAIHPKPIINLKDTFIFKGQFITLDPELNSLFGPYEYEWQDKTHYPTYDASVEGRYRLFVKDVIGCESTKEILLEVKSPYINVPNAFMPDASGENSRFYVKDVNFVDDFTLYVYNRWGELMFTSREIGFHGGWDGTNKGRNCQGGAYVWMVFSKGKMLEHGSVTLIR